jgi:KGK domain
MSNHYKIMTDRSKQVIPDTDTVVCLLDEAIIEALDYHDTYKIESLAQLLWRLNYSGSNDSMAVTILEEVLKTLYPNQSNINNSALAERIQKFVAQSKDTIPNAIDEDLEPFFAEGVNCRLLQPNGKGWQKGTLKICFEFIPEEDEPITAKEKLAETHQSPLDEIRQLSNELASVGSIEQN